jgi:hypothetical protein
MVDLNQDRRVSKQELVDGFLKVLEQQEAGRGFM